MPDSPADNTQLILRSRLTTRGESAIASTVLALAAILLCAMAASVWWAHKVSPFPWHPRTAWENLSGTGAIGAGGLTLVWFVYRRMRRRLEAILAIREALLSIVEGDIDTASLNVNPDLGAEAQAWNRILAETDRVRRQAAGERARRTLDARQDSRTEIDNACDVLPQGLILIDERGRVSYANGASAAFLRCKREEMLGVDLAKLVKIDSVAQALLELTGGNRRRWVLDVERKDGDDAGVLRFVIRPVRREDSGSAMVIIEDITQQRAAESARHRFVAHATHELRTPLTNIRLYAETAIEEGEKDAATRAKCLNVINSEARRLERIVGEMLSVAEIEAGSFKLKCDDVRLDGVFEEIKSDYQQQADDKHVALVFQLSPKLPVLHADRDKVLLAVHNLISNALKYTPSGGRITIIVDANEKQLVVRVRDSGIGISDADIEKIFDRFYRANDPRVAKLTGSGLGLTLAREVVRLHGGDITVESRLNEGSTFSLTLPVEKSAGRP